MGPGFPQYSSKWKTHGHSTALSRAHYDMGKYSMWIRIERGCKFWATLVGEIPTCPLTELVVKNHKWKVFVLEKDNILIMPPGTVHIVLTTKPSVAEGGHFYSKYGLHVASELVLQGLASSYADFIHDIASKKIPKPNSPLYNHVVGRWPPLPQLAALLAMVGHPEFFEPESPNGVAFSCSEHLLILCEKAIEDVKNMLAFLPEL
ncbi:hypothetical protein K439DRAFT_1617690 [Ramaria rubella]|nr:hypothetical protein K439DRAFT_1617690 [Ramaria rubella]